MVESAVLLYAESDLVSAACTVLEPKSHPCEPTLSKVAQIQGLIAPKTKRGVTPLNAVGYNLLPSYFHVVQVPSF